MELQSLIYLFVGVSFTIYFGLALWTKASSTKDFYVVNNSFKPLYGGISISIDFISAVTFISLSGAFLSFGYYSFAYLIGIFTGFIILVLVVAPYLRKEGMVLLPTFFAKKFDSNFLKFISICLVILISFIYVSAQIKGAGIVFSRIFQIDFNSALYIGLFVTLIYSFIGGIKTTTYTQISQYTIILFAFMTPVIFLTFNLTSTFLPQFALFSETKIILDETLIQKAILLDSFNQVLKYIGFNSLANLSLIDSICIAISIILGISVLPHILIKFFTTPTVNDAKKSALWAIVLTSIIYTSIISIFALSALNLIKNVNEVEYKSYINNEIIEENGLVNSGRWLSIWQHTNLINFEDLNKNNNIDLINNDKNELQINPDTLFLATPEIANLPNFVIALVLAGALAATLSTATGLILVIKTTITYELFEEILEKRRKSTIKQKNLLTKILIITLLILATFFNIPNYTILQTVTIAFTICAATFFPTFILSIFYKQTTKQGAIFGIISAIIFTISYIIYYIYFSNSINSFLMIDAQGIGCIGAILNFIVAIFVSKFTFRKMNQQI